MKKRNEAALSNASRDEEEQTKGRCAYSFGALLERCLLAAGHAGGHEAIIDYAASPPGHTPATVLPA
jgi:hypothetical protein